MQTEPAQGETRGPAAASSELQAQERQTIFVRRNCDVTRSDFPRQAKVGSKERIGPINIFCSSDAGGIGNQPGAIGLQSAP